MNTPITVPKTIPELLQFGSQSQLQEVETMLRALQTLKAQVYFPDGTIMEGGIVFAGNQATIKIQTVVYSPHK